MSAKYVETTVTYLGADWTVTGILTTGSPGRTYGPPEKCYPPEPPEWEDVSVCPAGTETDLTEFLAEVYSPSPAPSEDLFSALDEIMQLAEEKLGEEAYGQDPDAPHIPDPDPSNGDEAEAWTL